MLNTFLCKYRKNNLKTWWSNICAKKSSSLYTCIIPSPIQNINFAYPNKIVGGAISYRNRLCHLSPLLIREIILNGHTALLSSWFEESSVLHFPNFKNGIIMIFTLEDHLQKWNEINLYKALGTGHKVRSS